MLFRDCGINPLIFVAYEEGLVYCSGDKPTFESVDRKWRSGIYSEDFRASVRKKKNLDLILDDPDHRFLLHMVPMERRAHRPGMLGCVIDSGSVKPHTPVHQTPRIAMDICGVLADVSGALESYLTVPDPAECTNSTVSSAFFDGVPGDLRWKAEKSAAADPSFWFRVKPYPDVNLRQLGERLEFGESLCYLVAAHIHRLPTSADAVPPLLSLSSWLQKNGLCRSLGCIGPLPQESPTALALALGADCYVTASLNCFITAEAFGVRALLMDRDWNRGLVTDHRIKHIEDVFDLMIPRTYRGQFEPSAVA